MGDIPSTVTTYFNLGKWNAGNNPSSEGINGNWEKIDLALHDIAYGLTETNGSIGNWSGSPVGLDADMGRRSLGLDNIANLGTGAVSTAEFNYLSGLTGNIQGQLNTLNADRHTHGNIAELNSVDQNLSKLNSVEFAGLTANGDNNGLFAGTDLGFAKKAGQIAQLVAGAGKDFIFSKLGNAVVNAANIASGALTELMRLTTAGALIVLGSITSQAAQGTAPFLVSSTTQVANLNADLWDGNQFSDYLNQAVKTTSDVRFNYVEAWNGIETWFGNVAFGNNIRAKNKAANDWVTLAARDTGGSEVVYHLQNIGNITTRAIGGFDYLLANNAWTGFNLMGSAQRIIFGTSANNIENDWLVLTIERADSDWLHTWEVHASGNTYQRGNATVNGNGIFGGNLTVNGTGSNNFAGAINFTYGNATQIYTSATNGSIDIRANGTGGYAFGYAAGSGNFSYYGGATSSRFTVDNLGNTTLLGNLTVNGGNYNYIKGTIYMNGDGSVIKSTGNDPDISISSKQGTAGRLVINYNGGTGGISMRDGTTNETFAVSGAGNITSSGTGLNSFLGNLLINKSGGSNLTLGTGGVAGTTSESISGTIDFAGFGSVVKARIQVPEESANTWGTPFIIKTTVDSFGTNDLYERLRFTYDRKTILSDDCVGIGISALTERLNILGNTKQYGDIYSDNFNGVDPYLGYYIGRSGSVFSKITANELHVKAFIADLEMALAGSQIIAPSVAKIYSDFTVGGYLVVEEIPGFTGHVLVDGDFIRLRNQTRNDGGLSVVDIWGTATYVSRNDTTKTQTYSFTKLAGSGTTAKAGTLALDYGVAGNGIYETVAQGPLGKTPYSQIATYATNPWTDMKIITRVGDFSGVTDAILGSLTGFGVYTQRLYLSSMGAGTNAITMIADNNTAKLKLQTGGNTIFDFDTATSTALLAGWTINNVQFTGGSLTMHKDGIIKALKTSASDNQAGFYFDKDNVYFGSAADASYVKWNATSGINILSALFNLSAGNLALYGNTTSSYFKLGTLADVTTTATTNSGFRVENNGNILIKGAASGTDYIKVSGTGTGGIDINASLFKLLAGGLTIYGNSTSSYIKLGTITGMSDQSNTGTYIDNAGNFLSLCNGSNYIRRDATSLMIAATTFLLSSTNVSIGQNSGWFGANNILTYSANSVGFAGWTADSTKLYNNIDTNNGVRLEASWNGSSGLSGLGVKSAGFDVLKVGKFAFTDDAAFTLGYSTLDQGGAWTFNQRKEATTVIPWTFGTTNIGWSDKYYWSNVDTPIGYSIYKTLDSGLIGTSFYVDFALQARKPAAGPYTITKPDSVFIYLEYTLGGDTQRSCGRKLTPLEVDYGAQTSAGTQYYIDMYIPAGATNPKIVLYVTHTIKNSTTIYLENIIFQSFSIRRWNKPYVQVNDSGVKIFKSPTHNIKLTSDESVFNVPFLTVGNQLIFGDSSSWAIEVQTDPTAGIGQEQILVFKYNGAIVKKMYSNGTFN